MLPNDEIELNRLGESARGEIGVIEDGFNTRQDMQHKMWSITLDGKLHLAPIDPNLQNALDIGTGTGIWAIEFGGHPCPRVSPN